MGKVLLVLLVLLSGCATKQVAAKKVKIEFREIGDSLRVNYSIMVTKDGKKSYAVSGKALGVGDKIEKAFTEGSVVVINFNAEGARKLGEVTAGLIGQKMGILIDGELVAAPVIQEKITGGMVMISGSFTNKEAQEIVDGVNANNIK